MRDVFDNVKIGHFHHPRSKMVMLICFDSLCEIVKDTGHQVVSKHHPHSIGSHVPGGGNDKPIQLFVFVFVFGWGNAPMPQWDMSPNHCDQMYHLRGVFQKCTSMTRSPTAPSHSLWTLTEDTHWVLLTLPLCLSQSCGRLSGWCRWRWEGRGTRSDNWDHKSRIVSLLFKPFDNS